MIKSFIIKNYLNDALELVLTNPEESGIAVKSVTGLGPGKATVNIKEIASDDGGSFSGARTPVRNIVMDLIFLADPTIEDTRQKTYRYFPTKKPITFIVVTDNHTLEIEGIVESNEPDIFSNMEGCQISILCANPFFHTKKEQITTSSGEKPMLEFPIDNELVENPEVIDENRDLEYSWGNDSFIAFPPEKTDELFLNLDPAQLDLKSDGDRKFILSFYVDVDMYRYIKGENDDSSQTLSLESGYYTGVNEYNLDYIVISDLSICEISTGIDNKKLSKKKYEIEISEQILFDMKENGYKLVEKENDITVVGAKANGITFGLVQRDSSLGGNQRTHINEKTKVNVSNFYLYRIKVQQGPIVVEKDVILHSYPNNDLKVSPFYVILSNRRTECRVSNKDGNIPFSAEVQVTFPLNGTPTFATQTMDNFQISFPLSQSQFKEDGEYYLSFSFDGYFNYSGVYTNPKLLITMMQWWDNSPAVSEYAYKPMYSLSKGSDFSNQKVQYKLSLREINNIYEGNPIFIAVRIEGTNSNYEGITYNILIHDVAIIEKTTEVINPEPEPDPDNPSSNYGYLIDESMPDYTFTIGDTFYNLQASKGIIMGELNNYYFNHTLYYDGNKSIGYRMQIEFLSSLTRDKDEDPGYIVIKSNQYPGKKMTIDLKKIQELLPELETESGNPPVIDGNDYSPRSAQKGDIIFIDTRKKNKSIKYQKPNGVPDLPNGYIWDYENVKFNVLSSLNRGAEWFEISQGTNVFSIYHTFDPDNETLSKADSERVHADRLAVQIRNSVYYEGV